MKLKLNKSLRNALCATLYTASTYTLSSVSAVSLAAVSYGLLSEQVYAQHATLTNYQGERISPAVDTPGGFWTYDGQTLTADFGGGWFGGGTYTINATEGLIIEQWIESGGSTSTAILINSDIKSSSEEGVKNTFTFSYSGTSDHDYVLNGYHGAYTGTFIMAVTANGRDFVFTNTDMQVGETENISGSGRIELGVRSTATETLAANSVARDAIYYYTGDVSIGNSAIIADALSLNGKSTGANNSGAYTTSRTDSSNNGASYTISSILDLSTLELNDGSDAMLTGESVAIGTVAMRDANSTLGIGSQATQITTINMSSTASSIEISSTGSTIGSINFGSSTNSLSVAADAATTLTGTQTLSAANQISTSGSLTLGADVIFNIDAVDAGAWVRNGSTYSLQLIEFLGDGSAVGFSDLTQADNLIYGAGAGKTITFNSNGSISYTLSAITYAVDGPATWTTSSIGSTEFTNGGGVIIDANADLTVSGEISSSIVQIATGRTVSLVSADASSSLLSGDIQVMGTLELLDNNVLHTDSIVKFDGGTLSLAAGVEIAASQLGVVSGRTMNFSVAGSATITGQLSSGDSMSVSGGGSLTLAGALLAGNSTTAIAAGTTLTVSMGSASIGDLKTITGAGTMVFAGNDGRTRLDVDDFTGALVLDSASSGLRIMANRTDANRFDLTTTSADMLSVEMYSEHDAGNDLNTLYLRNLSGNINFTHDGNNGWARNDIDLSMTQDNVWNGVWNLDAGTKVGGIRVGSAAGEHYTFTMTQGLNGNPNHEQWNNLLIRNATVEMLGVANWTSTIQFASENATLHLKNNSDIILTKDYGGSENHGDMSSTSQGYGRFIVEMDEANSVSVENSNANYSGDIDVRSGRLVLLYADTFTNADMTVSGGRLDMNAVAQSMDVTMTGGSIINSGQWTGSLTVNAGSMATVNGMNGGFVTVNGTAQLTLAGTYNLTDAGSIINNGELTVDSGIVFNLNAIGEDAWERSGNQMTLRIIEGAGTLNGFDSLIWDTNFVYDETAGKEFTINANGSISYTIAALVYSGADANWSTTGIGSVAFVNSEKVIFDSTATITLTEAVDSELVIINGGDTITLAGDSAVGSLKSVIQIAGTLVLNDASLLHADSTIQFNNGILSLGDAVTMDAADLSTVGDNAFSFAVDAGVATITGQLESSLEMNVSGSGTLVLDGALLEGLSTTNIANTATLQVNTASNSTDFKAITGAGTLAYAATVDGHITRLDTSGFTGTINVLEGAKSLSLYTNYDATAQNRFDLKSDYTVSVDIYSNGAVGGITNGLFLRNLEGNVDFTHTPSVSGSNSYKRTYVNVEMTRDNEWNGTWDNRNTSTAGYFIVSSAAGEHHTMTMTRGMQTDAHHYEWNRLEIDNATVKMSGDANWKGNIEFMSETATIEFTGNSVNPLGPYGSFVSRGDSRDSIVDYGNIIINTGVDTNVVSINRASGIFTDANHAHMGYRGTLTVQSGTLSLGVANAFEFVNTIDVSGGVLNMNNHAQGNNVEMTGGSLTGTSAWTGDLTVTSGIAQVESMSGGAVSVASGADLTLHNNSSLANVSVDGTMTAEGEITVAGITAVNNAGVLNINADSSTNTLKVDGTAMLNVAEGKRFHVAALDTSGGAGTTINTASQSVDIIVRDASSSLTNVDFTSNSISGGSITGLNMTLKEGKSVSINSTTLTSTAITLENNSVLMLNDTVLNLDDSTISNAAATLILQEGNKIVKTVSTGAVVEDIQTLEKGIEDMLTFDIGGLSVATVDLNGSLTLDVTLIGDAVTLFNDAVAADNMIAFALSGVSPDALNTYYGNILINVYNGDAAEAELYAGAALGYANINGSLAFYIPEPSTVTMSLLALAGLLARRRRRS